MKLLITKILIVMAFTITANFVFAQDIKVTQSEAVKKIADSKNLIFKAQSANVTGNSASLNGSFVNNVPSGNNGHFTLNGDYGVVIKPDSISSYLPYFGDTQVENQPNQPGAMTLTVNENPVKFSTAKYDYLVQEKKKGIVMITIKPIDNKAIEKFIFEIQPNGSTKLTLNIADHDPISYNGIILQ